MAFWQLVLLAVTQGATEFLPISSSGHLVILAALLANGNSAPPWDVTDVNIVLHGGTLLSILVFYARRVWLLFTQHRRLAVLVLVGTIPAVAIGLPLEVLGLEAVLENPLFAGLLLPVTGLVLIWGARAPVGERLCERMSVGQALLIGVSQSAAILPGLSRSGLTISTALRLGLAPGEAATFSFLLAIPVIGGACLLKLISYFSNGGPTTPVGLLVAGATISFLVGLVALNWLVRWLERGQFDRFAWWCFGVGVLVVAWQLARRYNGM